MAVQIQLDVSPSFQQRVQLDGVFVSLRLRWNSRAQAWYLDVYADDGSAIVAGVRLVVGFPLLSRYTARGLPTGVLMAIDTTGAGSPAGYEDLGTRVILAYASLSEIV